MKTIRSLAVCLSMLLVWNTTQAQTNLATDLRTAQKLMAAGDYDKAFPEYLRAAEDKNNALAQFTLGLFYHYGWGRPAEPAQAFAWFEKAAAGGIPMAQHLLGDYLAAGKHGRADPNEAAVWYEKAAANGHYLSLCSLGELYMVGRGVEKNPAKAIALCQQAVQQGSVPAQIRLGRFFMEGDVSIRDYAKAYLCFEAAAQRNAAEAQYYLGVMHREGLGRPQAPAVARYWFESAASRKYGPAYLPTGELYLHAPPDPNTGNLSAHDLAKAYLWLSAASRQVTDPNDTKRVHTLIDQVNSIMPASWKPDLDAKVEAHFATKP